MVSQRGYVARVGVFKNFCEGGGLEYLQRQSEEPREDYIVMSDMTDEDAFNYIETVCKDKLKKYDVNEVKQIIKDITGGRISVLAKMVIEINDIRSLEGKSYKYMSPLFSLTN
jgi:hypothetical protein